MESNNNDIVSVAGMINRIKAAYPDPDGMLDSYILVEYITLDFRGRSPNVFDIRDSYLRYSAMPVSSVELKKRSINEMFKKLLGAWNEAYIYPFIKGMESLVNRIIFTIEIIKNLAEYFKVENEEFVMRMVWGIVDENEKK